MFELHAKRHAHSNVARSALPRMSIEQPIPCELQPSNRYLDYSRRTAVPRYRPTNGSAHLYYFKEHV
jgi:hypothetical protein